MKWLLSSCSFLGLDHRSAPGRNVYSLFFPAVAILVFLALFCGPSTLFAFEIPLAAGVNVIGIPAGSGAPADVAALVQALGGEAAVESVSRYNAATQALETVTFADGVLSGETFPIDASHGYVARLKQAAALSYEASLACPASYDFAAGKNLVAFACAGSVSAWDLLAEFGPDTVSAVQRLDPVSGRLATASWHVIYPTGENFPLSPGEGYFLIMKTAVSGWQPFQDTDGDGSPDASDCAPNDSRMGVGRAEVCGDDLDNDCNGVVDDLDADMDGSVAVACGGDDAADNDSARNPGVAEVCDDGADNNGDGLVDGLDPACGPGCDADGDGHPSPACGGTDYADNDLTVYPGAVEVCGDGKDNDEDGMVDQGCASPGSFFLTPQNALILATDQRLFQVTGDGAGERVWNFSLASPAGGPGEGSIASLPEAPRLAVYTAPATDTVLTEVIRATLQGAPWTSFTAEVTVYPLIGTYEITPSAPQLGLGRTVRFSAGLNVEGVGKIPLNRAYWKVNGVRKGTAATGHVDADGTYSAPDAMPSPLPFALSVGFSLTPAGQVLAEEPVMLAELAASPDTVEAITAGHAADFSAILRTSDGVVVNPVAVADLWFATNNLKVATVNQLGEIQVGDQAGRALLSVVHRATRAGDSAVVLSKSDVVLGADVTVLSDDDAQISRDTLGNVTRIELMRPYALLSLAPRVKFLRGAQAGALVAGANEAVSFSGDGSGVWDYADGDETTATGSVTTVTRRTGLVTMGTVHGTGAITLTYDDGPVHRTHVVEVVLTRPVLAITAQGSRSKATDHAFVSEYVDIKVSLTNPRPDSNFVARTPVEIETVSDTDISMRFGVDGMSGVSYPMSTTNLLAREPGQRRFSIEVSGTQTPYTWMAGNASFSVQPRAAGPLEFAVSVPNAWGLSSTVQTEIIRPTLAFRDTWLDGSVCVLGSWAPVQEDSTLPNMVSLFKIWNAEGSQNVFNDLRNTAPSWYVSRNDAEPRRVPLAWEAAVLPETPFNTGAYSVYMGLADRPWMRTEPVHFNVVTASSVAAAGILNGPGHANMFGAFSIVQPVGVVWQPGVPIQVVVDTMTMAGSLGTVGRTEYSVDGQGNKIPVRHQVVGLYVQQISGPDYTVSGPLYPTDESGRITFSITPEAAPDSGEKREDLIFKITPTTISNLSTSTYPNLPEMPESFEMAQFSDPKNASYQCQYLRAAGHGIVASPRQIPVVTQRLWDHVSAGRLTEEDLLLVQPSVGGAQLPAARFTVSGEENFRASLKAGLNPQSPAFDLGDGMFFYGAESDNDTLTLTVYTHPGTTPGARLITLAFNDGSTYSCGIEMCGVYLDKPDDHRDWNVPANARYAHREWDGSMSFHPAGMQGFHVRPETMENPTLALEMVDLRLVPSLMPGDTFRNAVVKNPTLGFYRRVDDATGEMVVERLEEGMFHYHNAWFHVWADTTDERTLIRTLDPDGNEVLSLGPEGHPDGLPDVVSPNPGAEKLFLSVAGNVADCVLLTVFNVEARMNRDQEEPGFTWASPLREKSGDVYDLYSGPPPSSLLANVAAAGNTAQAQVDHEAGRYNTWRNGRFLTIWLPDGFFAGMLDQYHIAEAGQAIATHDRVRAYDGERGQNLFDPDDGMHLGGHKLRSFGVELDGVLYDPTHANLGDYAPNSAELLSIPLVEDYWRGLGGSGGAASHLSADSGLLKNLGGTSGGWADLSRFYPGAHLVLSKTPAAELPGLHGGYLISGAPWNLTDPADASVEDDLRDVVLERVVSPGEPNMPLDEGQAGWGIKKKKRVLVYGKNRDQKAPVTASVRSSFAFDIVSDPAALFGLDNPLGVKTSLLLRERPPAREDTINFVTTSMSTGTEEMQKALVDTATDLAVDLTADLILNTITMGSSGVVCGGGSLKDLAADMGTALVSAAGGVATTELLAPYGDGAADTLSLVQGTIKTGNEIVPGVGFSVSLADMLSTGVSRKEIREAAAKAGWKSAVRQVWQPKVASISVCAAYKAPFVVLKSAIRDSWKASDLGGGGAAQAWGMKAAALSLPAETFGGIQPYTVQFATSRYSSMEPKENDPREMEAFAAFEAGRESDLMTDRDFLAYVMSRVDDPVSGKQARRLLNTVAGPAVWRRPASTSRHYEPYKLRWGTLFQMEGLVSPGMPMDKTVVPDFTLQVGRTRLPVAAGAAVSASRSNENAGAQAMVRCEGYDLLLLGTYIP